MSARYVHNYGAFGRQVLNSPQLAAKLHARGERVAEVFRSTAPVGEPYEGDDHPGRFRDSVTVHTAPNSGPAGDRVQTRITVNDPAGLSIEFGHHVYRDARGRFTHAPGTGPSRVEYLPGSRTLTNAMDAAR